MTSSHRYVQAAVLGDSDALPEACALAEQIGATLARMQVTLITGGRGGAMEAACRGAVGAGGLTIGILPTDQIDDSNPFCRAVVPTGLGHARNLLVVLSADFVVALGRSAGTLAEICLAWIHGRPIFTMEGFCGRWEDALAAGVDDRGTSRIVRCRDVDELEEHVSKLRPRS